MIPLAEHLLALRTLLGLVEPYLTEVQLSSVLERYEAERAQNSAPMPTSAVRR